MVSLLFKITFKIQLLEIYKSSVSGLEKLDNYGGKYGRILFKFFRILNFFFMWTGTEWNERT